MLAASRVFADIGATVVEMDGLVPSGMRSELGAVLMGEFADHYRDIWDDERVSPTDPRACSTRGATPRDRLREADASSRCETHMAFMRDFEEVDLLFSPGKPDTRSARRRHRSAARRGTR